MPSKIDLLLELRNIIGKSWEGNNEDRGIKHEIIHLMKKYPVIKETENMSSTDRLNNRKNKHVFYETIKQWVPDYSTCQSRADINYGLDLTDKFYFCRFGNTYVLEYATLYQLVFLDMMSALQRKNPKSYIYDNAESLEPIRINVLALGSGSLIDLFGMCLAATILDPYFNPYINPFCDPPIYEPYRRLFLLESYTGYDLCEWKVKFDIFLLYRFFMNNTYNGQNAITEHLGDDGNIIYAFGRGKTIRQNIIIFPKIINELDNTVFDSLIEAIEDTNFPEDEYYICFSHNKSDTNGDMPALQRSEYVVNAISGGEFNINSDILGNARHDILQRLYYDNISDILDTVIAGSNSIAYSFEKTNINSNYTTDYNSVFMGDYLGLKNQFKFLSYGFNHLMEHITRQYDIPEGKLRKVVSHAAGTIVFQIVKLTRRHKNYAF